MPMLVCIKQQEKVDGLTFLEVGNTRFPIRLVEKGLSEDEDDCRPLKDDKDDDVQNMTHGKAGFILSESKSAMSSGPDKLPGGELG